MVAVGDKIKMCGERQRYTVQGIRGHIIVATKPFNARKTYLYTLIDTEKKIRGPLNAIFGLMCDVNSPEGAQEFFAEVESSGGWSTWGVSHRREKPLTDREIAVFAE